ncbi:hypothetical protein [Salinarimonas soli]|uniref:Uncharacterized protein n=1 Tax=Salinarimonas soli TaxID=1638099 RepID=A0A5B2VB54_9HYPH|nr:hypothetical protein [Salinarimonas soli]KAA2235569.1 hypothetical protein F0L46_18880 [Salinarimonas soli]
MRHARRACRQAMASAPIGGDAYKAAGSVMDAIDEAAEILTGEPGAFLPRPHGGGRDGTPNPTPGETSPALQAAIFDVLRAELYVSYVDDEGQNDHLRALAAKVTTAALVVAYTAQGDS